MQELRDCLFHPQQHDIPLSVEGSRNMPKEAVSRRARRSGRESRRQAHTSRQRGTADVDPNLPPRPRRTLNRRRFPPPPSSTSAVALVATNNRHTTSNGAGVAPTQVSGCAPSQSLPRGALVPVNTRPFAHQPRAVAPTDECLKSPLQRPRLPSTGSALKCGRLRRSSSRTTPEADHVHTRSDTERPQACRLDSAERSRDMRRPTTAAHPVNVCNRHSCAPAGNDGNRNA